MPSGRLAGDCMELHDSLQRGASAAARCRHEFLSLSSTPGCWAEEPAARRPHMQEGTVELALSLFGRSEAIQGQGKSW